METLKPNKVVVHPLVLLSVVDHYNRVAKDTKNRVVGVLLGSIHKGVVDVTNSFAGFVFLLALSHLNLTPLHERMNACVIHPLHA